MARKGLDAEQVVAAAAEIVDVAGLDGVTLAAVAARLGVRPPSLYNHVAGRDELLRGLALRSTRELTAALRNAAVGRAGTDALAATAHAYRDYARAHPGRYAATVRAPEPGDTEHAEVAGDALDVVTTALRAWALDEEEAIHAVRTIRSALHGFVALECGGGFGIPLDLDTSFERLVATLAAGLSAPPG